MKINRLDSNYSIEMDSKEIEEFLDCLHKPWQWASIRRLAYLRERIMEKKTEYKKE